MLEALGVLGWKEMVGEGGEGAELAAAGIDAGAFLGCGVLLGGGAYPLLAVYDVEDLSADGAVF